jgi:hypothetical protein
MRAHVNATHHVEPGRKNDPLSTSQEILVHELIPDAAIPSLPSGSSETDGTETDCEVFPRVHIGSS